MTERDIFLEALEMPNQEARVAFLQGACGRDAALRRQVDEHRFSPGPHRETRLIIGFGETAKINLT